MALKNHLTLFTLLLLSSSLLISTTKQADQAATETTQEGQSGTPATEEKDEVLDDDLEALLKEADEAISTMAEDKKGLNDGEEGSEEDDEEEEELTQEQIQGIANNQGKLQQDVGEGMDQLQDLMDQIGELMNDKEVEALLKKDPKELTEDERREADILRKSHRDLQIKMNQLVDDMQKLEEQKKQIDDTGIADELRKIEQGDKEAPEELEEGEEPKVGGEADKEPEQKAEVVGAEEQSLNK